MFYYSQGQDVRQIIRKQECVKVCTGSDHPLDADPRWINLFGELVDSLCGVFVGIRVYVGLYSWKGDCRRRHNLRANPTALTVLKVKLAPSLT